VALADGFNRVGFIAWFADSAAAQMTGLAPLAALVLMLLMLLINFLAHYLFASVTAHVTAIIPVLLAVGPTVPGLAIGTLSLLLGLQLCIMRSIAPFAAGYGPVYYGSGYLPSGDYWRLGAIFGAISSLRSS
jgi:L-tartrate/succinate antiporter